MTTILLRIKHELFGHPKADFTDTAIAERTCKCGFVWRHSDMY
jgi:hypothetical protein